jgi:hypothetical protein
MRLSLRTKTLSVFILAVSCAGSVLWMSNERKNDTVLSRGEVVRSVEYRAGSPDVDATETFINIPMDYKEVVRRIRQENPGAMSIDDSDGINLVVPQVLSGRVQIFDAPKKSFTVLQGRTSTIDTPVVGDQDWTTVRVREFRRRNVIESAFAWIGDRLGI